MNRYTEIRKANTDLAAVYRESIESLEKLRRMFSSEFDCARLVNSNLDYSYFAFMDSVVRQKGLKYTIFYDHETNKVELYLSGRNREVNDQIKALLGLEGGVDWIYMFVLSEDYSPEDESENSDIYEKALSYIEFIETELEDIV